MSLKFLKYIFRFFQRKNFKKNFKYFLCISGCKNFDLCAVYKIITDPELVEIFKMLYSKVDIVSPSTISWDIQNMHAIAKRNVAKSLQSTRSRLHFGIDGWSSPNVISFLGVTVTRCIKGIMEEVVLDFIR